MYYSAPCNDVRDVSTGLEPRQAATIARRWHTDKMYAITYTIIPMTIIVILVQETTLFAKDCPPHAGTSFWVKKKKKNTTVEGLNHYDPSKVEICSLGNPEC